MNGPKLEACPFCGGDAYFDRLGTPRASAIIRCGDCGCSMESGDVGENSGRTWNRREPAPAPEATAIEPIEIGVGKIRVAICYDGDDPAKVLRELVIYDDGGGYQPVGTDQPEHRGKAVPDVGRMLARLRISNAEGAAVFLRDLQAVIEHARVADGGAPVEPLRAYEWMRKNPDECAAAIAGAYGRYDGEQDFGELLDEEVEYQQRKAALTKGGAQS